MWSNIKKVSFPREHGSWGFLLEPLTLSLLVASSPNGLLLALATFVIFLNHQPVRILLNENDSKKIKSSAIVFFLIYFLVIGILLISITRETTLELLIPFSISIVIMFGYLVLEIKNYGRNLFAEFIAPVAIIFVALNIVLLDGWEFEKIFAFGIVLLSRTIPTLLYVRTKVKIIKGQNSESLWLRVTELFFLILITILALIKLIPILSIFAVLLLISRSIVGLQPKNKMEKIKKLGMKEFGFGILFVVINAVGYLFNL